MFFTIQSRHIFSKSSTNYKYTLKRFYPAGRYIWEIPSHVFEVDVFLVGGGGGTPQNEYHNGAGSGYTKTFRGHNYSKQLGEWEGDFENGRNGNSISVSPNQKIEIIVGKGGETNGSYSQFLNSSYRAEGGKNCPGHGGDGGSGGGAHSNPTYEGTYAGNGGSNGSDGGKSDDNRYVASGVGQGYTTRDFGEPWGKINAGGGAGILCMGDNIVLAQNYGGVSDYTEGSAQSFGCDPLRNGGGYGGGGGGHLQYVSEVGSYTIGGDGTVLIRYIQQSKPFTRRTSRRTQEIRAIFLVTQMLWC